VRATHTLKIITIFLLLLIIAVNSSIAYADNQKTQELRIGVLAKRGTELVEKRWSDTAIYLNQQLTNTQFIIVPLRFDEIETAIDRQTIDFLLTNPSMFVDFSISHKLFALATLKRNILNQSFTEFGSVIFTLKDNIKIRHLRDLTDKSVAAVNRNSLGGWIAAIRELDSLGVSEESFDSLQFLGTHDEVVYAVKNTSAEVGIIRTDTLERMHQEGKINIDDFKALSPINTSSNKNNLENNYPLLLSTRLYREWPFASLPHISSNIAEKLSTALIAMPSNSTAALSSQSLGWTIPKDYREVDLAFAQLKINHYAILADYSFFDVLIRYWKYLLISLIVLSLLITNTLYIVSVNRKLASTQKELHFRATRDPLTKLPNRVMFYELASRFLHIALRDQKKCIVLFLDLDRFKTINDTHGHDIGDLLLKEVSKRMSDMLRDNDIIARIGGDEFLIMLSNIDSVKSFESIMQRLIEVVTQPLTTESGLEIDVGCSIGAAHYPRHGSLLKELIKKADTALYQAKNSGRGKFIIYDKN